MFHKYKFFKGGKKSEKIGRNDNNNAADILNGSFSLWEKQYKNIHCNR